MLRQPRFAGVVHVRVGGKSHDIPLADLGLTPSTLTDDAALKRILARRFDLPERAWNDLVIDRHPSGNVTVRPEAVFG